MWNIQRMSFYVEYLHLYNNFFVRVYVHTPNGLEKLFPEKKSRYLVFYPTPQNQKLNCRIYSYSIDLTFQDKLNTVLFARLMVSSQHD